MMNTWKPNLEKTKKHYIDWWNHKGIVLNMWEHFQEGVKPHADIPAPTPYKDLNQRWFDPLSGVFGPFYENQKQSQRRVIAIW